MFRDFGSFETALIRTISKRYLTHQRLFRTLYRFYTFKLAELLQRLLFCKSEC